MADTEFDICSDALGLVGASTIDSFDDGSAESDLCGRIYERFVEAKLGAHKWRFATDLVSLGAKLASTPVGTWEYAFQLPTNLLTLHGCYRNSQPINYDRFGRKIFCDEDADVYCEHTFRQTEANWGPLFKDAFILDFASRLAMSLVRNTNLAGQYANRALDAWQMARTKESQQQTTKKLVGNRLTGVRRAGGYTPGTVEGA